MRSLNRIGVAIAAALQLVSVPGARAQSPRDSAAHKRAGQFVYQNLSYGSQRYFTPLTVLINKGFDHFQAANSRRDVWAFPYGRALRNGAFDAITHPRRAIEHYPGWRRWFETEILPLNVKQQDAPWAVNWTEHLLAGGMTYRALDEWFRVRGMPLPRVSAALTTFSASLLNEAMENPDVPHAASSSVADLLVFDLGGILLFNWDPLVRFFGGTLQYADWSYMGTFTFPNRELRNSGQYYIIKPPLPWTRTRLFIRGGMGVQVGLSRRIVGDDAVTLALGADTETRTVDSVTAREAIRLKPGGGVYWDRNNSLLASLNFSPNADAVKINVYPGVLAGFARDLGVWAARTREGEFMAGIVSRQALGLGVGFGR